MAGYQLRIYMFSLQMESEMSIQINDTVKHAEINFVMKVTGLSDFKGTDLAYCEWTDLNGAERRTFFPCSELEILRPLGGGAANSR
jgi:hypothetical protein